SGAFNSLTTSGMPSNITASLGYDANDVFLDVKLSALSPLLISPTRNEANTAAGIDAAIKQGGVASGGMAALFNLSGVSLDHALDQASGGIAPNLARAASQSFRPFLTSMMSQGASNGSSATAGALQLTQSGIGTPRVWGAVVGGYAGLSANSTTGAAGLSASNVGLAAGVDAGINANLRAGAGIGISMENFSSGNGTGSSRDLMLGLYARQTVLKNGYVSASFGYGLHDIHTSRVVTVSSVDVLKANFPAWEYGGRIEGGYRVTLGGRYGFTPYAAVTAENFEAPAYAESAAFGSSSFASSYASHATDISHTEFGVRLDRDLALDKAIVSLTATAAWAHELDTDPTAFASFQSLPGSNFALYGVRPATDTALLGLHADVRNTNGVVYGIRVNSQVGLGTTIVEGAGMLAYRW
ncbi:MAG: autotransporter outer membrane beta-barrel domain-containing protein, partial [Gemmataceae bacterium]